MEMAIPPDVAHFNQYANENVTTSSARPSTYQSDSDERKTATEISAESDNGADLDHIAPIPTVTSHFRRDLEDLLWARTQKAATPGIDFNGLATLSLDQWEPHGSHREGFHTYSRRLATPKATEVLVTGELDCSLAEAAALLRCPGEFDFNSAMSNIQMRFHEPYVHQSNSFGTAGALASDVPTSTGFDSTNFLEMRELRASTSLPLEATNGRIISVLVCSNCLQSVQNCNYAHLAASSVFGHESGSSVSTASPISLFAGADVYFHTTQVLPDADDGPEPGHAVVTYLEDTLSDPVEYSSGSLEWQSTAVNVLQQLVNTLDEGVNRVLEHSSSNTEGPRDPEFEIMSALQRLQIQFQRELLPLKACVLSNAVTRAYPIDTSGGSAGISAVPIGPIPPNEANRLQAIAHEQLLLARGSDELVLICELATRELDCLAALVTIVGSTTQFVLASNSPLFQNAELPREHTLCQHLLMGDRPMLVQHPEADVRFCNLNLVVDYGIQFYAGFPIFSHDGLSVVGSLVKYHYGKM
ncbi:hypothetical protein JG688_00006418 [Phytophthora aleatoria]|uniref:GAF domain-containing protein n=1 Tax=Phytophthora aleatoria TaxID=2496075 RepID=A0A8J5J0Z5_9STRA|nr:hypothetical protein JG688_00006418 [Phytophthora aleatoria]